MKSCITVTYPYISPLPLSICRSYVSSIFFLRIASPLLRYSGLSYRRNYVPLYYFQREPGEGASCGRGLQTVYRISRCTGGCAHHDLHAIHTSPHRLQGSFGRRDRKNSTYSATPNIQASGSCVVINLETRYALATVASSLYRTTTTVEIPTQSKWLSFMVNAS